MTEHIEFRRVDTHDGPEIEPSLKMSWDEHTQMRWYAATTELATGLNIDVIEARDDKGERFLDIYYVVILDSNREHTRCGKRVMGPSGVIDYLQGIRDGVSLNKTTGPQVTPEQELEFTRAYEQDSQFTTETETQPEAHEPNPECLEITFPPRQEFDTTNEPEPYIKIDFGAIRPKNPRLVTCLNCNKTETLETYSQTQQWIKTHEYHQVGIQADAATYLGPDGETTLPDNWNTGPYKP